MEKVQSVLRQIVAGPRARHPEARLDLCYVTDYLIATSGPSATYPSRAYRNPLDALVRFLDEKHGADWGIWEFRAEGTGYPDDAVYGRIWHWPWPDHHPPPFGIVPGIIGGMREWLHPHPPGDDGAVAQAKDGKAGKDKGGRVVVVHCKAGKGRSGTAACAYLMSDEGWGKEDAKQRFTERRMRPGFGAGISIPSQVRWLDYVERWIKGGKVYVERAIEVAEVHVWGLRDGAKIAIEGYVENGKVIKTFHVFTKEERDDVEELKAIQSSSSFSDLVSEAIGRKPKSREQSRSPASSRQTTTDPLKPLTINTNNALLSADSAASGAETPDSTASSKPDRTKSNDSPAATNAIFRPSSRVILPTSDINLAVERRSHGGYGWAVVTAVAHVWFNCFFEGNGPENMATSASPQTAPDDAGVFTIEWDAMDGIKGSSRKGTRAFDKVAVVWRAVPADDPSGRGRQSTVIKESDAGEAVKSSEAADWRLGAEAGEDGMARKLGPVDQSDVERDESSKEVDARKEPSKQDEADQREDSENSEDGAEGVQRGLRLPEAGTEAEKPGSTGNVPGDELRDRQEHTLGDVKLDKKENVTST